MTEGEAGPPDTSVPEHSPTTCCLSEKETALPHSYTLGSILISPYEKGSGRRRKKAKEKSRVLIPEGARD